MRSRFFNLSSSCSHSLHCHSLEPVAISHSLLKYPSLPTRSVPSFFDICRPCQHRNHFGTVVPVHRYPNLQSPPSCLHLSNPRSPRNAIRSSILNFSSHLPRARSSHLYRRYAHLGPPAAYIRSFSSYHSRHSSTTPSTSPVPITSATSSTNTDKHLPTQTMAKKIPTASSDSSLSSPPDNTASATETAAVIQPAVNDKKRKAETTPRTRRSTAQHVDIEDDVEGTGESSEPKRRVIKKAKITEEMGDEAAAQESGDGERKTKKVEVRGNKKAVATKKAVAKDHVMEGADGDGKVTAKTSVKKTARGKKAKANDEGNDVEDKPKPKAKTKTKTAKIEPPRAERTKDIKHRIGAHVSIAGGVHNSIVNMVYIGANAFALFMKNQRKWESAAMDPEHANLFIQGCKDHNINAAECCLPHGSYLVNLAHPDPVRKKQAYDSFLDDLTRCHALGIRLYNFHPGNANATTREEGIRIIAENLNRAHADPTTGKVVTVLETMASLGNTIGGTFADLAAIINLVNDKSRVGVCLDTCHVFAAGYDLRSPETYAETIEKFDKEIGLKYLKAFHVNDSKAPLASYRDMHARIGTGYLGLQAFHNLMNDERFYGLPMVLETPIDTIDENGKKVDDKGIDAREIKLLESLVGMDNKSDDFKALSARLQDEGASERVRVGDQVQRKTIKDAKPKKKRAAKKKAEGEDDEDMEE